ncbi:MAG: type II secretion system protein GspM [Myxococcota bacterium]|nr:type II secretion system protein GspM [Myxococcota bacterium]
MNSYLQQIRAFFDNLAPREKVLVSAVGGLFLLTVLWFGVVQRAVGFADSVEQRVATAQQQLELLDRLRRQFEEVNGRLSNVEQRIASGPRGNLRTTLETIATRTSVKIESMEPQSSPAHERYRETKVEVGLKEVSLPQVVRYLHEIESSDQVYSVKTLRIRTRSDNPELLDVTFTVSSFEAI